MAFSRAAFASRPALPENLIIEPIAYLLIATQSERGEDAPRFAEAAVTTPALHELKGRQRRFSDAFDHLERNTLNAALSGDMHPHDRLPGLAEDAPATPAGASAGTLASRGGLSPARGR